jgi:putative aminopeptidase FrvX
MSETLALLKAVSEVHGVSGFEAPVARLVRAEVADICDVSSDRLGSVICKLKSAPEGPRVALAGHMDEIGFMVKVVTKEGFIKLQTVGGWWDQVLLGQRVIIHGQRGLVTGVIGAKPPHLLPADQRNNLVKVADMFVDVGASSKEQVEALGVRVGDCVVPDSPFTALGPEGRLLGKAWDDRVGVALFVHALQRLSGKALPCQVYGLGTVQEEVGLRGATTAAAATAPDVGIILETAIAGDVPGISEDESGVKLGGGPAIYLMDGSMIAQLKLRDLVMEVCTANEIPYQVTLLAGGGTDGGKIHLHAEGVPSIVLGVPTRHIHSHAGIIDQKDYDQTLELLCRLVERLDAETVAGLTAAD